MYRSRGILILAVLGAGCSGTIESPYPGKTGPGGSTGPNGTPGATAGSSSNGTAGTSNGAPNGSSGATGSSGNGSTPNSSTGVPTNCAPGIPGTSQLPRLTNAQYDNTIRDLFQISATPSSVLAPDSVGSVDERTWEGYKSAADAVVAQVMADPAAKARVIPCTTQDAACIGQVIDQFGQLVFRRPVAAPEKDRFLAMFNQGAEITENGSFDEIAALILKSFLISPSFLTRAETAQTADSINAANFVLSSYEVASRLSYMLWDSMPDAELFTAAASDALKTPAQILTQAERMLTNPKARAKVAAFHDQYLHIGGGTRWAEVERDANKYPLFTQAMVPMLAQSTQRFLDYVVFEAKGTFQDIVTRPSAFVNATLAPLYDLDPSGFGPDLTLTNLGAKRPGVFTQVGFLTVNSAFGRSSPILRGAFLQKDVLCTHFDAPPANAQTTPVPTTGKTNRENTDALTAGPDCTGCHTAYINPVGYALESYDAIGKWQTNELDTGAAIDTSATVILGDAEVNVTGPEELMAAIAASPYAQHCYASKWVQFAYQRSLTPQDACTVDAMTQRLTTGGYTVQNLITDLTQSESFRLRAPEVTQ